MSIPQILIAVVPIVISILTLRLTSKQIEDSTRPYLAIYQTKINLGQVRSILILKNFGQSAAIIESIKYSDKLLDLSYRSDMKPFMSIPGTTIAPGQSFRCEIKSAQATNFIVNFEISYKSLSGKKYNETTSLKLDANNQNIQQRINLKDPNLNKVFYAMQEMIEQNL